MKFELNLNEVNLILTALAKMPYEVSSELIHKIKHEGESQLASKEETQE